MNKSERPATYNQISTIFDWFIWHMPTPMAREACEWLKTKSAREVSDEITRLYPKAHGHCLTRDFCFAGDIWKGSGLQTEYHELTPLEQYRQTRERILKQREKITQKKEESGRN